MLKGRSSISPGELIAVAVIFANLVAAQTPAVSGPRETFVFDAPTGSIRGVWGALGSSWLAEPSVRELAFASVAPGQNYAIGVRRGQVMLFSGLGSDTLSATALPSPLGVPESVAWSADGSFAVVYSRTGNWVQILGGFPSAVNVGQVISTASLGGALSAVAIDNQGRNVVAAVTGDYAGVYGISDAGLTPLLTTSNPTSLAFSDDGTVLYVLDAASHQGFALTVSSLAASGVQSWPIGLTDPIGIASGRDSSNRQIVYVVGRQDRSLIEYDGANYQSILQLPLSFEPECMASLGSGNFLLRPRSAVSDPIWTFANIPQPMAYFVPAPLPPGPSDSGREVRVR